MGKVDKIIFKSYEVMDKGCHFFYEIDGEETKLYLNHSTSYILNFQQQETIFLNIGMCYLLDLAELLIPNYVEINFYMSSDQLKYWSSLYKEVSKEKCCIEKINLEELEKTQWSIHGKKNDSNLIVLDSSIKKTMLCLTGGKESLTLLKLLKGKKDLHLFFWNLETCVHRSKAYERVKKDLPTTKSLSNRNEVIKKLGLKYKTSLGSGVDMAHLVFNALLFSPEYVLIGNEYSSNFPNKMYQGSMINHQYVKTIEFAKNLNQYIHSFVAKDYHYFSPLFSIYGIKIAASLFKDDEYLEIWTSCNQTTKEINFCSKCSKCAFTYLVSLLYTSENFLRKFFSRDMLEDLSLFKILMDFTSDKPFDCVGEKIEVWVALDELSANKEFSDKKAIRYFQEKIKPFISGEMAQFKEEVYSLQKVPVDLPLDLQEIIKKAYEKK